MDDTFLTGTTSSIIVQNLGKIVQRAPAVGAKMWCLFFFYRQDAAKRQTAGIVFKQTDADFAANSILRMVIIDIIIKNY